MVMSTLSTPSGELTKRLTIEDRASYDAAVSASEGFEEWTDRADWLMWRAPITRGHGSHATAFAAYLARKIVAGNRDTNACVLLLERWSMDCDPQWSREQLQTMANEAYTAWSRAQPEEPWALRARAKAAEKRTTEEARKSHAEENKRLAEALGISVRYVRMLRSEGTAQPETAKTMAAILGGKPETYMRRARRRGRRIDLVALLMKVQADACGFTDFIADPPEELTGDAREMIDMLRVRGATDFESLEALISHVGALEFETVGVESAVTVWRAFKRWRIQRIATLACFTIDESDGLR
jgi:hypothetical protein